MHRLTICRVTMIALVIGMSAPVAADKSAEDAVKYRQSIMKAMSGHNGVISLIARGKAGDPENLSSHVEALVKLTAELETVFEEDTPVDDTEALPAIWEEPEKFADALVLFEDAVATLSDVAGSGDMQAIDAAHREMGKACKGCHEDFRLKDE